MHNSESKLVFPFEIQRLVKGGDGLAYFDGKAFFIPNALPSETGTALVYENKKNFGRARVLTRNTISPLRREHDPCALAESCDGCGFRFIKREFALPYKAQPIYSEIQKIAKIDLPPFLLIPTPNDDKRRRIRLHWTQNGIGFFARRSHSTISAAHCDAIHHKLQEITSWLEQYSHSIDNKSIQFQIDVQIDLDDDENAFASFAPISETIDENRSTHPPKNKRPHKTPPTKNAKTDATSHDIQAIIDKIASKAIENHIFLGVKTPKGILGTPKLQTTVTPLAMPNASPLPSTIMWRQIGDFAQALPSANAQIHALLDDFISKLAQTSPIRSVADLFSGSGNLTFRAATRIPIVKAYERFCSKDAFLCGVRDNRSVFPANSQVTLDLCDLNSGLPKDAYSADLILCDPARNGISQKLALDILNSNAHALFYVSCEASALARDLTRLKDGFRVEQIAFVDMFPETPHVETVVSLVRSSIHKYNKIQ